MDPHATAMLDQQGAAVREYMANLDPDFRAILGRNRDATAMGRAIVCDLMCHCGDLESFVARCLAWDTLMKDCE